jgi:hypothetical protein
MRALVTAFLVLSLSAISAGQSPRPAQQPGRVTLRGVVVDAGDGSVLRRARIALLSGGRATAQHLTDEEGRFSISVASAALTLRIVKAGYASVLARIPPERLRASEPLRLEVPRGAAITGRAVDASGQAAQVVFIRRLTTDGLTWSPLTLDGLTFPDGFTSVSPNDRGEYRAAGLVAGRYRVEACPPAGTAMSISTPPGGGPPTVKIDGASYQVPSVTVDVAAGAEVTAADLFVDRPAVLPDVSAESSGGTIRGTVSTTGGSPLPGATVTATRPGGGPGGGPRTTTDASGRFTLRGVAFGSVTVQASKRGYVPLQAGQRGGGLPGLPVRIEAGKDVDDVSIVLPRSGAVSGLVLDEYGEPLLEVSVQLLRVRRQPTGALLREQGSLAVQTDDRGQFRFSDVRPGDYAVMASLPEESLDRPATLRTAYVPAYYPDTTAFNNAATIRIAEGDDVPGTILTMRRVPVTRVSGVVHNSQGLPFTGTVRLNMRHLLGQAPVSARSVTAQPSGEFVFDDVPPGDYLVMVQGAPGPAGPEFAAVPVMIVDREPVPVSVRTSPGSKVSGRVVLEGGAGDVLWGYSIALAPLEPVSSAGSVSNQAPISTGEPFTLTALAGPTRLRVWSDDQQWYLKSIVIDGLDVVDAPFDFGFDGRVYSDVEVVFSRRGATITGRATTDRATPVRDYAVYVFSTDRDRWFAHSRWVRLARAAADGGFTASSLPPGEYWVIAVDRVDASSDPNWVDTELLTMLLSRAARVTLGEGQSLSLTLRVMDR